MRQLVLASLLVMACGCFDPAAFQKKADEAAAANEAAAPPVAAQPNQQAAPPVMMPQGEAGIPDVEAIIVDKQKVAVEHPDWKETEEKINATDPLSAASQSYFALGQRVHILNFKHNIDVFYASEGRWPTYDEMIEMFAQFDMKLKHLKPWQVYAYDQSDGTIVVMNNLEEKKRRYEAAGLEFKD